MRSFSVKQRPNPEWGANKREKDTNGRGTIKEERNLSLCFAKGAQEVIERTWWVQIISEVILQRVKRGIEKNKKGVSIRERKKGSFTQDTHDYLV